jgi:anti-sigma B factor antagonist
MPTGSSRSFQAEGVPFRVDVVCDGGGRIALVASGELDHFSAPVLAQALAAAAQGRGDVMVDVAAVTFCDAGGLNCFVDGWVRLRESGRHLSLARPTPALARLLSIAGVEHLLG